MLNNKKGYSLTVLIIAIAVILIITTTAVISIKNIDKDKEISKFMSDLEDVNQYVVEYFARNNVLPCEYENGEMKSAEDELIQILSSGDALQQLDEDDMGDYYYVDITKLGKIRLNDNDRGYIVNEGTMNIYVKVPCKYEDVNYYTLTPYLLGEEVVQKGVAPFEINVMGNPITWAEKANLLVSIPNVEIGKADGWNFKWLKGAKTATDFKETEGYVNYFKYGDVITLTENGIYTIYVENPERLGIIRRVVVSKIDDIAPTISFVSGEIFIDDGETGINKIRCKIKENSNYPLSDADREACPEYYTMSDESFNDTKETLLKKYLWDEENIKGDTIETYLAKYKTYYENYSTYTSVLNDINSTSGEKDNARSAIDLLNKNYPQFVYNGFVFSDTERNIVLYVEDMVGNGAVYSALSREDIRRMQYVSSDVVTLAGSKVVINNNKTYTDSQEVNLYLESLYAKYVFITETKDALPEWEEFDSSNISYTLSSGDGEKIVYVAFKDVSGKTQVVYDKIILDGTKPTDLVVSVSGTLDNININCNQTDSNIVNGIETQTGIEKTQYGIKKTFQNSYTWYSKVEDIPELEVGRMYMTLTQVTDKAGNKQNSQSVIFYATSSDEEIKFLEIGDYVVYAGESSNVYKIDSNLTGYTNDNGKTLGPASVKWRIWDIEDDGDIVIMPVEPVNSIYLGTEKGFVNSINVINNLSKIYTNITLDVKENDVRALKESDLESVSNLISLRNTNSKYGKTNATINNNQGYTSGKFYTNENGDTPITTPLVASTSNPVVIKHTYYSVSPQWNSLKSNKFLSDTYGTLLGDTEGWLASVSTNALDSYMNFSIRFVKKSSVDAKYVYRSSNNQYSYSRGIRPLVTLDATLLIKSGNGYENSGLEFSK